MRSLSAVDSRPLATQVSAAVTCGRVSLPPLPELATRLLRLLRDEDRADLRSAGELIANEPAMATSVLRLANSAFFGGLCQLADLSEAVVRLGLRQVSSLVTAVAHRGHFESDDPRKLKTLRALWDHAVASALAARILAVRGDGDMAEAFLAGLLHDTGKLLVLKGVDHLERRGDRPRISLALVAELMDELHAELGHQTLTQWKIPDPVCRVALHHHDPDLPAEDVLTVRVQLASAVAKRLGAHLPTDRDPDLLDVPAAQRLGLGAPELASLVVEVEEEYEGVRALL